MDDLSDLLHVWRLLIVYLTLLGVYLILLGVAVAGLITAKEKQRQDRNARPAG